MLRELLECYRDTTWPERLFALAVVLTVVAVIFYEPSFKGLLR